VKPLLSAAISFALVVLIVAGCTPATVIQSSGPVISLSGVVGDAIALTLGVPLTSQASEPNYTGNYTFTVANASIATVSVPPGPSAHRRNAASTATDKQGDVTITPVGVGSTTLTVQTSNASLTVILSVANAAPSPTPTPTATPTPTPPPPGVLSVNPTTLSFYTTGASAEQTVFVQETDFSGTLSETDSCSGIVTVSPTSSSSPYSAIVTPVAAGTCTITFTDGTKTAPVAVTVTTAGITVNAKARLP